MNSRALAAALVAVVVLAASASAADDATLFRVFLKDGGSLVSYGEFARVDDRVVFSMPTSAAPDPPLQLVNIAADRVDWVRTERYADSARANHYVTTQAEDDYAALTGDVARALNDVALTTDPARRLAIVEQARKTLGDWPRAHYNYRWDDVQQMLAMLDEAIADLRVAAGAQRFELSLSANVAPPVESLEPLLPAPTPKEAIEQALSAARSPNRRPSGRRCSRRRSRSGSRRRQRCPQAGRARCARRRAAKSTRRSRPIAPTQRCPRRRWRWPIATRATPTCAASSA